MQDDCKAIARRLQSDCLTNTLRLRIHRKAIAKRLQDYCKVIFNIAIAKGFLFIVVAVQRDYEEKANVVLFLSLYLFHLYDNQHCTAQKEAYSAKSVLACSSTVAWTVAR
jgi:hypothetical protein